MNTIKWKRPSGSLIETNDSPETIAHCESMGWTREAKRVVKKAAKKAAK